MVQDFAKTPKSPVEFAPEPAAPASPAPWSLLITGLVTGLALGLFVSFLAYISGLLPALPSQQQSSLISVPVSNDTGDEDTVLSEELERAAARLQLEFYRELPNYEVVVDATPLDLPPSQRRQPQTETTQDTGTGSDADAGTGSQTAAATTAPAPTASGSYMIQAGAFQQQNAATAQRDRLLALGLNAQVKQEALLGRNLYLVQSGPYTREQAVQVERILRGSNIDNMRVTLGNR